MPEPSVLHGATIDALMANAGRSTLAFKQANADRNHATAFWFNDLVDATSGTEVVSQYLVTAAEMTRYGLGELTLRPELCEPVTSAEKLLVTDFADAWTVLGDLGVAVMPTAGLHAHGRRKGWNWTTDEITDGLAAHPDDIARIGAEPRPAYILGHDVGQTDGARLQAVVVGQVARGDDGHVRWDSTVPEGCAGAPVFVGEALGDDRFKLVCVGLVLAGEKQNRIATFDRIRAAVRESEADRATGPAADSVADSVVDSEPAPDPGGEAVRRTSWWRRKPPKPRTP
ncbi:hypothetical protein [Streptomyces pratensis]|uniref:hypothetical protein n=1 Tax=Streptomyces pratensis TaxID=1169025 RepID=UPI00193308B0|nr:hypothetical protein [Streptomyces pratensis]